MPVEEIQHFLCTQVPQGNFRPNPQALVREGGVAHAAIRSSALRPDPTSPLSSSSAAWGDNVRGRGTLRLKNWPTDLGRRKRRLEKIVEEIREERTPNQIEGVKRSQIAMLVADPAFVTEEVFGCDRYQVSDCRSV